MTFGGNIKENKKTEVRQNAIIFTQMGLNESIKFNIKVHH